MSFRIENKYLINNQNHEDFYKFLSNCSAEVLYPRRKISSIYFDNLELQSYRDSVEGLVPRKKIRIRCYPNINETYQKDNLEIKINSVEGRYKEIKKNINTEYYFNHGYFDAQYGLCLPIIKIQYIKEKKKQQES